MAKKGKMLFRTNIVCYSFDNIYFLIIIVNIFTKSVFQQSNTYLSYDKQRV
jgi:hypothetical protein